MDVKEAVGTAKTYVADLFADEEIAHVGLEEIVFDELSGDWKVTIGFSRPWSQFNAVVTALDPDRHGRAYKVVRIKDCDGSIVSLTDRLLVERPD